MPSATSSLSAEQADRSGTRDQRGLPEPHVRDFRDSLHHRGKWLADGRFLERKAVGKAIELVRTHHEIAREGAVHAVPHPAAILAEDEVARAAVRALRRR